jgi:hypothetical protein
MTVRVTVRVAFFMCPVFMVVIMIAMTMLLFQFKRSS